MTASKSSSPGAGGGSSQRLRFDAGELPGSRAKQAYPCNTRRGNSSGLGGSSGMCQGEGGRSRERTDLLSSGGDVLTLPTGQIKRTDSELGLLVQAELGEGWEVRGTRDL